MTPRQEARAAGATHYQGSPCKRGHDGLRNTVTGACRQCGIDARAAARADPEGRARDAVTRASWKAANRETYLARKRESAARYREHDRAQKRARAAEVRASPEYQAALAHKAAAKALKAAQILAERTRKAALRLTKEEVLERKRKRHRIKSKARKALYRGASSATATAWQIELIRLMQGARCAYCGSNADLHMDHILAVKNGGAHSADNLQFLCAFHNVSKRDYWDKEYRLWKRLPDITWWDISVARAIWLA